jgi:hypothetical protein
LFGELSVHEPAVIAGDETMLGGTRTGLKRRNKRKKKK